ncbi:MAG: hypothetical protein WAT20_04835 [Ferruginibacter sp.]
MTGIKAVFVFVLIFLCLTVFAQNDAIPFAKQTTKENREKEYLSLLRNINSNLLLPLTDSTEENWQDALDAIILLNYRTTFIDTRIRIAMDTIAYRSVAFQKAMLQVIYPLYPKDFVLQVTALANTTTDPKSFAMCCEYLLLNNRQEACKILMQARTGDSLINLDGTRHFFMVLQNHIFFKPTPAPPLADLLNKSFLPNEMVMYSFQRKNRNYPGLVMVRSKDGQFIKEAAGKYFAVPQLARSCTNMPGYLSNGNTPQGIFKIFGFAVSQGNFIGPTTNIQMVLPYENSSDVSDSVTRSLGDNYRSFLPASWKSYFPIFEAYFAGKAGRTEIIAHGTTVNPAYYNKQLYYPLTPTQGCLSTKEMWSTIDGKRMESDQQKLADTVKKAGGADGYCIVIEIDDQQKPVTIKDILPFLK